ncbi:MAG: hypothetical protein HN390_02395 [Anaerolineae bacterium]|nr:hypothetical protein [Anaerolineae bacterium]MBT7188981.1 hypothetical protein [Anaerolineae bacterium]MBT7990201.1 hypothetical protein [Anaerolineae bacterium]
MDWEQIAAYLMVILGLVVIIGISVGLDFKKWWNWLFVLAGFLLSLLMQVASGNESSTKVESICLGIFFAVGVLIMGPVSRYHKRKWRK